MNLNSIVSGAINTINPDILLSIQVSAGTTVNAQYQQVPSYASPVTVPGQVQPLTWRDIQQLDGLNLQGVRKRIYINGVVDGLVRATNKGGDLITISSGPFAGVWLVALVLEAWGTWTAAACTLQDGS